MSIQSDVEMLSIQAVEIYAKKNNIDVSIDYAGTIEIMSKLNNGEKYDAVWCSNSIWLYMLDSKIKTTNSKSTSINPVVFGIKKSKAPQGSILKIISRAEKLSDGIVILLIFAVSVILICISLVCAMKAMKKREF